LQPVAVPSLVRSFTNIVKQHHLLSLYSSYNIDVIGLQETNFKPQHEKIFNPTHPTFISFFSSNPKQRTAFGVGLILNKKIAHHVYKHDAKLDRIIHVDLQFANKQKLCIINCYLPPADLKMRKEIQLVLRKWIQEASNNDFHLIVLGDFNADMDRTHNPTDSLKLFEVFHRLSLFDAFSIKHDRNRTNFPTYFSSRVSSRIDYI
jgi:exonuclease III